jgi:hypothetical protein
MNLPVYRYAIGAVALVCDLPGCGNVFTTINGDDLPLRMI